MNGPMAAFNSKDLKFKKMKLLEFKNEFLS